MSDDWASKLDLTIQKFNSLPIILENKCLGCLKEALLHQPVVLRAKLVLDFLPKHDTILTIVCKDCTTVDSARLVSNIQEVLTNTDEWTFSNGTDTVSTGEYIVGRWTKEQENEIG